MKAYKRFLSYSYEPFRLHFCGPQDDASTKLVDDFLKGFDISAARLNRVARDFAGVYPYLELIAKKNKLEPLDEQVIEAYWIGNNLLRQVTVEDLKNLILQSFIGPGKLSLSAGERLAGFMPGGLGPGDRLRRRGYPSQISAFDRQAKRSQARP